MNIVVYCGSNPGNNPKYAEAALKLGKWIGTSGFDYQSECHCSKTQPLFVSFLFVRKEALEELVFF